MTESVNASTETTVGDGQLDDKKGHPRFRMTQIKTVTMGGRLYTFYGIKERLPGEAWPQEYQGAGFIPTVR